MAGGLNKTGPVIIAPTGTQLTTPPRALIPIVRDFPPVSTSILPDPTALAATAPKRNSNTVNIVAAKAGDIEPYIFGRTICKPTIIASDDSGPYLVIDLLWAGHECEEIEYLIYSNKNEGLGTQLGNNQHFHGAVGQIASTVMATAKGGSYDILPGKTHSVVSWLFAFGLDIRAMIKGAKLYDPRNSPQTEIYSANPALCLARILTDSGYTMDWDSVATAADYCDELLGSPGEKRWEVGLQITEQASLRHWVQTFATYCNCFVEIVGNTVYLVPDAPRSPNHTVLAANLLAGSARVTRAGSQQVPEYVEVGYTHITEAGSPSDRVIAQARTAATATTATAGSISQLNLPGLQTYSRARRVAELTYAKAHNDTALECTSFDEGIERTLGDVGTITHAQVGLTAQTMALTENKQLERGRWRRKYVTYDAGNYSDAVWAEPAINDTVLESPYKPPVGPTPTLVEEEYTDDASVTYQRLKITFTGIEWAYVESYRVTVTSEDEVKIDTHINHGGAVEHTLYTGAIVAGNTYTVKVYTRSNTDKYGAAGVGSATGGVFSVTAKHFGSGTSPVNYYTVGMTDAVSPKVWTGGLIPATGSGDAWQAMTLVFCVYPVTHDNDRVFIFGSGQAQFSVATNDSDGGLWLAARDASTNGVQSVVLAASGSPSDGGGLAAGAWHAVMISAQVNGGGIDVVIWIDGAQVYSGAWNTAGTSFNPMDYVGPCYVGAGDFPSGSAPGHDPDFWEGLNHYLSYVWCKEEYLDPATYWTDFFDGSNKPLDVGADGSTVTGVAPESFFPDADFTNNRGTGPNWTEVGTVPAAPSSPSD